MKAIKVHGMKSWNNGWGGRRGWDRAIEKSTRQAARREIEAQLAEEADEDDREAREAEYAEYIDGVYQKMVERAANL